jgi:hypothetical protein
MRLFHSEIDPMPNADDKGGRQSERQNVGWILTGGEHGDDTLDRRAERSDKQENTRGLAAQPELLDQPCLSAFKIGASRRAIDTSAGPTSHCRCTFRPR